MKILSRRDYSILLASLVDHFDTALYGFLAPIFAVNFFPSSDPVISLILAYSVLATTIVTRPLGSYIFGLISFTHGPAISLSYSLVGVGITTLGLALVPTYEQIGYLGTIALIILRFLNGIFSAGEINIAKLYILSDKADKEAGRNSYLYQTSVMLGIIIASFMSNIILIHQEYWRICYVIGGLTALFGYAIRMYKSKPLTLSKKRLLSLYSTGGLKILLKNKILLTRIAIISGFSYITYSIPFIVINNLVPLFSNLTIQELMYSNNAILILDMILIPIIGSIVTKFEPRKVLAFSVIILTITILPMWYFVFGASLSYVVIIKLWIVIVGVVFSCVVNLWLNNLISTDEKYLITGIGNAIGSSIIGKMAPAICLGLYHYSNSYFAPIWLMLLVAIATIWAIMYSANNSKYF